MKMTRTALPVNKQIGGSPQELYLHELSSEGHGPSVYLQASVHGAEVQGNATLFELVNLIKENELKGSVRFIALANPWGTNQKRGTATAGRFDPVTGNNWNRGYFNFAKVSEADWNKAVALVAQECTEEFNTSAKVLFKKWMHEILTKEIEKKFTSDGLSYEKTMLYTLQREALSADMVIDLHTGPIACQYLYAPENCEKQARDLGALVTLLVPLEFGGAMDEAAFTPWHLLSEKLAAKNLKIPAPFESYTLELASEEVISFKEARREARRIGHFLFKRGILAHDPLSENDTPKKLHVGPLGHYKTLFAPHSGLYDYVAKVGQVVEKGDILCKILTLPLPSSLENWNEAKIELKANKKAVIVNHCPSGIVSEGMELYQYLELS